MNNATFSRLFPLGTHLCREPMPAMAELKRDMENLQRHGFNLIKLQEHWNVDEPVEGQFDFSRYEELIAHAATLDMGVYLGLTCEQAPAWLWRKHPGCRMIGRDGRVIAFEAITTLPSDGKPGPCFDHPGALAEQTRFLTKLVETLGRFENLVVWNTWQEIGYWAEGLVGTGVCFCPHTLEHFRRWLREQYGDLDALNRTWNMRYGAWEDVTPSRAKLTPIAVDIAWQYFMDNVQIAGVLRARAEAIRAADPLKRPIFAHKGGPAIGSGQDWTYARTQDFLGTSCYPAWGSGLAWDDAKQQKPITREAALLAEMWSSITLHYDYIRSCNRPGSPVWAAEFQGGPVSTEFHKGRVPSAEDIRRWMLTAVTTGVTAISFWVTRAEIMAAESNGFSLLDSAGDTTPRFAEAARVGQALNANADLFAHPTLAPAEVGILVNEWNSQFCALLGQGQAGTHLAYSTRGWHRLLWEMNIPLDFVEVSQLDAEMLPYKTLILPFPLSLSETAAATLARFVERGGTLICEAAPGRIDEYGFCNRGELSPAMAALCGVRQQSFTMVGEPEGGARWSPAERTWGEYLDPAQLTGTGPLNGHHLRANVYIETFACLDSEPVLQYGDAVAGTRRRAGKGQAWLLGTYAGHNGAAYCDPDTRACLRAVLAQGDLESSYPGQLLLRKRVISGKEAWLFTNPTSEPITETIDVTGWTQVSDLLGALVQHDGNRVTLTVEGLDVRGLIVTR